MLQCIFQCGVKVILPLVLQVGGNTEMTATHLREVHYQLAITCDLYKSLTSMSVQRVLEHCSGCKAKHANEHAEQEGCKAKKSHKKKSKAQEQEKLPKVSSGGIDESCRMKRYLMPSIPFC